MLFRFGGGWGISLLIFSKQIAKPHYLCFAKIFGHRSKTAHCAVFSLRSNPPILFYAKQKSTPMGAFSFWRRMGDSNPRARKGNRFSRLSKVFPKRSCLSLILPDFPDIQAYSSQLPGNLRENCEKAARKTKNAHTIICRTDYNTKISKSQ